MITLRLQLDQIDDAYAIFGQAAKTGALKVLIEAQGGNFTDLFTSSDSTSSRRKVYSSCIYCD
ncbi:MAG: hypothetical protein ACXVK3_17690 [Candidatus Angelobacter sp.]